MSGNQRQLPGHMRIVAALVAMIGLLASTGIVSAHDGVEHDDPVQEISFTINNDGVLQEPEIVAQDGPEVTFRDFKTSDVIEGDISGSAVTHWEMGRIHLEEECSGAECVDAIFSNHAEIWGTVEIQTETGRWSGQTAYTTTESGEAKGSMFLVGRGDNAGMAIIAELQGTSADVEGVQFTGRMVTMDGPKRGLNIYFDGCAIPPDHGAGSMIMHLGDTYDAGSWSADYPMSQQGGASFANVSMELEKGTINGQLLLQAHGTHRFGYFMINGGTGEYEDLYGFGKIRTGVYESASCGENTGLGGYWIGQATAH